MVAFTICSNNYIAKAQVLASSIKRLSNIPVYLFLADSKNAFINYSELGFDQVILAEDLKIENFQWMKRNYSVVELNTALKSFAFQYIYSSTTYNTAYYFDPDIKVYQPLGAFDSFWDDATIALTPHVLSPVPFDGKFPGENLFMNHGTFNLGFIGIKRSEIASDFLKWWSERLSNKCIVDLNEGFFVDQLWCNLVPVYFKSQVKLIDHPGWNMAYWNLHERRISFHDNSIYVNETEPLFFYHFSAFDPQLVKLSPGGQAARYSFDSLPQLKNLYHEYKENYLMFDPPKFNSIEYFNGDFPVKPAPVPLRKRILGKVKSHFFK